MKGHTTLPWFVAVAVTNAVGRMKLVFDIADALGDFESAIAEESLECLRSQPCEKTDYFTLAESVGYLRGVADALGISRGRFVGAIGFPDSEIESSEQLIAVAHAARRWLNLEQEEDEAQGEDS